MDEAEGRNPVASQRQFRSRCDPDVTPRDSLTFAQLLRRRAERYPTHKSDHWLWVGRFACALARLRHDAPEIVRARSRLAAPRARSERIRRSMETDGSPPSVFATRDWLEWSSFARSVWLRLRFWRRRLKLSASRSRSSTHAVSSPDRPRNSCVVPNLQPFVSSLSFLLLGIIVFLQSPPTSVQDRHGRLGCLLGEHVCDHDRVRIDAIDDDAPRDSLVNHPQLLASRTNGRSGSRPPHHVLYGLPSGQSETARSHRGPRGGRPRSTRAAGNGDRQGAGRCVGGRRSAPDSPPFSSPRDRSRYH